MPLILYPVHEAGKQAAMFIIGMGKEDDLVSKRLRALAAAMVGHELDLAGKPKCLIMCLFRMITLGMNSLKPC